jgi:hypothetical protein
LSFISLSYSLDYVCSPGHRSTTPKALVTLITCENMHVGYCPFVAERAQQKKPSLSTDSSMSVGNLAETSNWVVIGHYACQPRWKSTLGYSQSPKPNKRAKETATTSVVSPTQDPDPSRIPPSNHVAIEKLYQIPHNESAYLSEHHNRQYFCHLLGGRGALCIRNITGLRFRRDF